MSATLFSTDVDASGHETEREMDNLHLEGPEISDEGANDEHPVRTRRFATILNLLCALLGAGVLSVPNSFTNAGIVPSILLLILMAVLSHVGTVITVTLQAETQSDGFPDLAGRILGRSGEVGLSIMSLLYLVSAQLGYLILGGDMIVSLFSVAGIDLSGMWPRAIVTAVYAIVFPIALTLPKRTDYFKYMGMVTAASVLFFDIAIIL